MPSSPILLSCFSNRVLFYAWAAPDYNHPIYFSHVAGMAGMLQHTQLLLFEMGSWKLFAQTGLELWSSQSLPPKKLWL
jgi:hypothetical protein